MIRDFLESFKYSGFMFPVGLLRIYIGYNFFTQALSKMQSDYFVHPLIAAKITEWLPYSQAPDWYKSWLEVDIIPNENWKTLAYAITFIETTIGVSFLIGFFIRPIALLGSLLMVHYIWAQGLELVPYYQMQIVLFFVLFLLGAGRSMGVDYYFYKTQRGFLW